MCVNNRGKFESFVPWIILVVLLTYTFALFFVSPYLGFQYRASTGEIVDLFVASTASNNLELGDVLLSFGDLDWMDYSDSLNKTLLEEYVQGDNVELQVRRGNEHLNIRWYMPGISREEFLNRLINTWPTGYLFWLAGTATLLLVRPKNARRLLLASFFYVTSIWLVAGNVSSTHVWGSAYILRIALWLSLPIYLHFHWYFPNSFSSIGRWFWNALYVIALLGATGQLTNLLSQNAHIWPFSIAAVGTIAILLARYFLRPAERKDIGLLFASAGFAFAPSLALAITNIQGGYDPVLPGLVFSMIALPGAYFYVVYRRQLGGLELRANRVISIYLYLVILLTITFVFLPILLSNSANLQNTIGIIAVSVLLTTLATVLGFNRFQRFVERRILNIPLAPEQLFENFASKIATSITTQNLIRVLRDEVLPSLLIRQSALFQFRSDSEPELLYAEDLEKRQLPQKKEIATLLERSGKNLSPIAGPPEADDFSTSWVKLSIPLVVGEQIQGLWLLGRRDPDDHYSANISSMLLALADQTAIALANIAQAGQLRALYQTDIERQELERTHLARELHDDVLNRFAEMKMNLEQNSLTKDFEQSYQQSVDYLRATIHGLRPPMLNYGLHAGLSELVDDLIQRNGNDPQISLLIPKSADRADEMVEQHLYRIAQQALENAIRHAQAQKIEIAGAIHRDQISLVIKDDGKGFNVKKGFDLVSLLAERHFGLAGMSERAALIGAELNIVSSPGSGSEVQVHWAKKD